MMLKKISTICFLLAICTMALAQVDYNKIIIPGSSAGLSDEEKLVQIAWKNYPANEMLWHELEVANSDINLARWSWLNNFYVQGNLNEFTIDPDKSAQGIFWPRYNIGVSLPLGIFVRVPNETKKAKETYKIRESNINKQKLFIRATVMGFYRQYRTLEEIYKIEKAGSDDASDMFALAEQKFKNQEITLEEYNGAQEIRNTKRIRTLIAENDYLQVKLKLEELIGMRVEEALAK